VTILINLGAAASVEGAFAAEPISARAVLIFAVTGIIGAYVGWTFAGELRRLSFLQGGLNHEQIDKRKLFRDPSGTQEAD
jgi:hypothetical protein